MVETILGHYHATDIAFLKMINVDKSNKKYIISERKQENDLNDLHSIRLRRCRYFIKKMYETTRCFKWNHFWTFTSPLIILNTQYKSYATLPKRP